MLPYCARVECYFAFPESGAGKEARTPDLNLGKVALYQLSYSRFVSTINYLGLLFFAGFVWFVPKTVPPQNEHSIKCQT